MKLALDLGTHTGFSRSVNGIFTASGVLNLTSETKGQLFLKLAQYLEASAPEEVAVENVQFRHSSRLASHVYFGLLATVEMYCEREQVPLVKVNVAAVKKAATGKGAGPKEWVKEAIEKKGFSLASRGVRSFDEADAISVGLAAGFYKAAK